MTDLQVQRERCSNSRNRSIDSHASFFPSSSFLLVSVNPFPLLLNLLLPSFLTLDLLNHVTFDSFRSSLPCSDSFEPFRNMRILFLERDYSERVWVCTNPREGDDISLSEDEKLFVSGCCESSKRGIKNNSELLETSETLKRPEEGRV